MAPSWKSRLHIRVQPPLYRLTPITAATSVVLGSSLRSSALSDRADAVLEKLRDRQSKKVGNLSEILHLYAAPTAQDLADPWRFMPAPLGQGAVV